MLISPVSGSTSDSGTRKMPRPAMVLPCRNCAAIATSLVEILRCGAALHMDVAEAIGFEIAGVDLKLFRRRLHHHAARLARRDRDRIADAMRAARRERAHVVRAGIAIGGVDVDILDRHTEGLGRDLARHGLHPLAEVDGREQHAVNLPLGLECTSAWLGSPPQFMPIG